MSDDRTSIRETTTIDTDKKLRHGTITSVGVGISSTDTGDSVSDGLQQPYEIHVLKSLRRIIRALDLYSRRLKSSYGLTVPQLVCLSAIAKEGPMSSIELSQQVQLSPSTIVGILDRLQKMGLIVRERSVTDRRLVMLSASDHGKEVIAGAPSPLQDSLTRALKNLPASEQETIARSLGRVVELMQAQDIKVAPILTLEKNDFSVKGTKGKRKKS
jgi:DNA-binding MarR family transcriptional regulator